MFSAPARVQAEPAEFRLCDPREATFAAYVVHASPASALVPGVPNPLRMSGALVRVQLVNARQCGGSIALDDLTGTVAFTYASGTFHRMVQVATPLAVFTEQCGECGQWESEHRNPNASACDRFDVEPRPGTPANPLCLAEACGQPRTHHGLWFPLACHSFEG
ncbi:hypothetical protein ACWD1Y_11490 [Streptomyces sp. NPDC002814]